MQIISNHHRYPIIYGFELSERWRKEFDYLEKDELDSQMFVKYHDWVYSVGDFTNLHNRMWVSGDVSEQFKGWDGYITDSFFSGVLIKVDEDDTEYVKMGRFFS